ncbi:MAG: glycosyltransferase family 4 protein [Phaeodactylibacter sp.]|nr:glycosyltransferase family 4 protein [Phaeodactylibacter sp.]
MPASRKIAFLTNSVWNIVNYRMPLIQACRDQGFEPLILAPKDDFAGPIPAGWTCHYLKQLSPGGKNPLQDLRLFLEIWQALRQYRPALVCSFTIKPNIYGSLAAAPLKIPCLPTITGLGYSFLQKGLLSRLTALLYRQAFRKTRQVVFQNKDDRRLFIEQGLLRPEQTVLIPGSGVDTQHFYPDFPTSAAPCSFIYIGRLLWDKGLGEFVQAIRGLKRRYPNLRVHWLGAQDHNNPAVIDSAQVEAWEREGLIHWLGPQADVRPFIAAADALVLPSYREGLPRAVLEAMAMAKPVIVTDVPGCRELVDKKNGLLAPVKDPQGLEQVLQTFLELPESQRQEMGRTGRQLAEQQFDNQIIVRNYLSLIQSF